jgi:xanthine dehydrogenase accessory factor
VFQSSPALQRDDLPAPIGWAPAAATTATHLDVLRFIAEASQRGQRVALATITGLTGSSSRAVGTLMGVAADGSFAGSFSGGCIEAAVVAEAQEAILAGRPRQVRYGAGSPYIDIKLPYGGGVDLLFQPDPAPDELRHAIALLNARQPLILAQHASGGLTARGGFSRQPPEWQGETFISWHAPPLRLILMGHGAESLALVQLGSAYGAKITMLSPDERAVAFAEQMGAQAKLMTKPDLAQDFAVDAWSAVVFLFHDHGWEPLLLKRALAQPAFFIGAMGSRRTHASRLEKLRELGVQEDLLARISAPLGLIPTARDPVTLAFSALAQVVDGYRQITASASYGSK